MSGQGRFPFQSSWFLRVPGVALLRNAPRFGLTEAAGPVVFTDFALGQNGGFDASAFEDTAFYTQTGTRSVSLNATEAQDTASVSVSITNGVVASLNATEAQDTASVSASIFTPVSLNVTEAQDTASFTVLPLLSASLAATEAQDTASVSASIFTPVSLAATEAQDTASVSASVFTPVSLNVTEAQDTASVSSSIFTPVSLSVTEAQDTASFAVTPYWPVSLNVTEAQDTASVSASVFTPVSLSVTEAQDTASFAAVRLTTLSAGPALFTVSSNPVILKLNRVIPVQYGSYFYTGYRARLSKSVFFYNDSEIIYVPPEVNIIYVDPEAAEVDPVVAVPSEVKVVYAEFENRLIMVPTNDNIEELSEDRTVALPSRVRAI